MRLPFIGLLAPLLLVTASRPSPAPAPVQLALVNARGWMRRLHGRWFKLPDATFDAIHYGGMAAYKIGILLFNLAPLLALWLLRR